MVTGGGAARLRGAALAATWAALCAFEAAPAAVSGRLLSTTPGQPDVTVTAGASPGLAAPTPALRRYVDGANRFSLDVPAGWAVRKETGSAEVTLLNGDATLSASVEPAEPGDADEATQMLGLYAQDVARQCPGADVGATQTAGLGGLKGVAVVITCPGPRKPTTGQFMFAQAGGEILIFNFVAPTADLPALKPALAWVLVSLQLASHPHPRDRGPEAAARWVDFVKDACRADVFSQLQCAARLADAQREAGEAKR